jgi:hypothetical protein
MFQLSIYYKGLTIFNSAEPVITKYSGSHGGVKYGSLMSYSSIISDVMTIDDAYKIVAEVNQYLVSEDREPLTEFLLNQRLYKVL